MYNSSYLDAIVSYSTKFVSRNDCIPSAEKPQQGRRNREEHSSKGVLRHSSIGCSNGHRVFRRRSRRRNQEDRVRVRHRGLASPAAGAHRRAEARARNWDMMFRGLDRPSSRKPRWSTRWRSRWPRRSTPSSPVRPIPASSGLIYQKFQRSRHTDRQCHSRRARRSGPAHRLYRHRSGKIRHQRRPPSRQEDGRQGQHRRVDDNPRHGQPGSAACGLHQEQSRPSIRT